MSPSPAPPVLPVGNIPELTLRVVLLGILLSIVMGAANVYVGLKVGMTVSASIPAAVMAMLIFRMLPKRGTILEANQVQTAASAGESLAAGIIFTMPALVMMGVWTDFDYWTVTAVSFAGGLLGILLMIPMRKVFVVDNDELAYPEGVACAKVLETGASEGGDEVGARALIIGGLLGAVFKFGQGFLNLLSHTLEAATERVGRIFYIGGDVSPMLVAVGVIVRLNVAVLIFIGGAIAWLIGIPLLGLLDHSTVLDILEKPEDTPVSSLMHAKALWSSQVRYVGVGAMVVGGIASIISVRHGLMRAVAELTGRGRKGTDDTQRDLPKGVIVVLSIMCVCGVCAIYYHFTKRWDITILSTVVMLVMSFFFTAVASYIVGLVGNSNSPVSGMTITAVLFTGLMMSMFDMVGTEVMVAIIGVAAIVCCVACTAGDVCNDLKTGSLVGAAPHRQQIMQIVGAGVAAFIMAPILTLLHNNTEGGIGGPLLPAPQAGLFKSLAEGFAGVGVLPWGLIQIGAGVGVVILILDGVLKAKGSGFRLHIMPVAVGMYLPFRLATPILLGGIIAHLATRRRNKEEHDSILHRGVLFSSGVIAGEALMGVGLAILGALDYKGLVDVTASMWVTGLVALLVLWLFRSMTRSKD
jgi:putative OPT family oligopeptide transporter